MAPQANNKISERIQALQQSSQYPAHKEGRQQAIDTRLSVKGRAARFSQFDTGKPLEPVRYKSISDNNQRQIIGNRIPRASMGATSGDQGAGDALAGAQRSVSAGAGATIEQKNQRRRSEDISMLNTSRLSIMSDQSSQSVPTPNMLRANSAILAELIDGVGKGESLNAPVDPTSGMCTVVSSSRSPTPKQSEEGETPQPSKPKPEPVPSLVVVPPKDNSAEAKVKREREKRLQYDENDPDNGWKYIATNKAKQAEAPAPDDGAEDFGPSMPLDERFNFISLTEPSAISKLEPKLGESGGSIPPAQQQRQNYRAGSHKSRLSTSDSIANSHADSTKSTFKTSMGKIFKGRMFRRRKTLEGVQIRTAQSDVPPLPTSFSQTLPALRGIEPMKISLPTTEEMERREEEKQKHKREREEEIARNKMIQEERMRKLKEASRSKSSLQEKQDKKQDIKQDKKEAEPLKKKPQLEPEFAIEDADWATAVIREFN